MYLSTLYNDRQFGCQVSSTDIFHNAILFIDIFNNAWYKQAQWLIEMPYLAIIASNDLPKV